MKKSKTYLYLVAIALIILLPAMFSCSLLGLYNKNTESKDGDITLKFSNPQASSYDEDNYVEGEATLSIKDGNIDSYSYLVKNGSSTGNYNATKMRVFVQDSKTTKSILNVNTITWERQSFNLTNFDDPVYDFDPSGSNYSMVKVEYFYNNGLITKLNFLAYNPNDSSYSNSGEDVFDYYENGNLKLIREADTYDSNEPIYDMADYFTYNNPNFPNFPDGKKEFYSSSQSLDVNYDYDNDPDEYNDDDDMYKYSYITDPNTGNITTRVEERYNFDSETETWEWENREKISVSYDASDNINKISIYSWNTSNNNWEMNAQIDISGVPEGVTLEFDDLFSFPWRYILGIYAN